jgi:transmembrane sensor
MKKSERIGLLMYRFMTGDITNAQRKELLAWRSQSAKHETAFQEATDWDKVRADLQWSEFNSNAVLEKIKEKYPGLWQKEEKPKVKIRLMTRMWRAAAIIITFWMFTDYQMALYANAKPHPGTYAGMIDGSANIVFLHDFRRGFKAGKANLKIIEHENGDIDYVATNNPKRPDKIYDLVTYRGNAFVLRLPGMGSIWVNASTTIWYPAKFVADTLRIKLTGEAYFEMDPGKVAAIEILPTPHVRGQLPTVISETGSFNIHAYPADSLKVANDEQSAAWKNRMLYYKDASLKSILDEISRWYDVDVVYLSPIPGKKFSIGVPRNTEFPEVVRILKEQGAGLYVDKKTIYLQNL